MIWGGPTSAGALWVVVLWFPGFTDTLCAGVRLAEIDEDLQSRQLAVYGKAAMSKMMASRVLISGESAGCVSMHALVPSMPHSNRTRQFRVRRGREARGD